MPCTSDYPEPTSHNQLLQETAQLYLYLDEKLRESKSAVPNYEPLSKSRRAKVTETSKDVYANEDFVASLCSSLRTLRKVNAKLFDKVVYDAKSSKSRRLADWWERHEAADRERVRREKASKKQEVEVLRLWQSITASQRKLLKRILSDTEAARAALDIIDTVEVGEE